jgi:hypothetical protein
MTGAAAIHLLVAAQVLLPGFAPGPPGVPGPQAHRTTAADTLTLPAEWPPEFPAMPPGASLAGVTRVDAQRAGQEHSGPYHIVAVNLEGSDEEAFTYYHEALRESGWRIVDALTNDGSRPGLVTIGFQGHGYRGDIRFQDVLGMVVGTIHLYREGPVEERGGP